MMAGARDHVVANVEKGALFALCSCAMVAEWAAEAYMRGKHWPKARPLPPPRFHEHKQKRPHP
jgi:hypothetical protein